MKRANNWPAKLALFIEEKRRVPFDWASNNCAFFACDWLAIVHGVDPASELRGQITGALSAARIMDEAGGVEAIAAAACARWGWPEVPVGAAMRGDIVVTDNPGGPSLGVCDGAQAVFAGTNGIEFRRMEDCRKAWRI